MTSIISTATFIIALLVSYFAANALFEAADKKYNILEPFRARLLKVKNKKFLKRYFLFITFVIYIVFTGFFRFNDIESGISLGIFASFVLLVYKPLNSNLK